MSKKLSKEELIARLATELGVTLKPAGGRETTVDLPEFGVSVEVTMRVRLLVSRDAQKDFREEALAQLAHYDSGAWTDECDCNVRDRRSWVQAGAKTSCKKPVIGVVVNRTNISWKRDAPEYTYRYSFRCHIHLSKPSGDETSVVFRDTLGHHALKSAREKRVKDAAERKRLLAMTPEQRVAEDAKAYGRTEDIKAILGTERRHSYRCDKMRATADAPGTFLNGYPDVACTCGGGA